MANKGNINMVGHASEFGRAGGPLCNRSTVLVPTPVRDAKMFGCQPDMGIRRQKVHSDLDRPMRKSRAKFVRMIAEPPPLFSRVLLRLREIKIRP